MAAIRAFFKFTNTYANIIYACAFSKLTFSNCTEVKETLFFLNVEFLNLSNPRENSYAFIKTMNCILTPFLQFD